LTQQTNLPELAHTREEFRFALALPYDEAAPLFGAWAEQKWDPDWKPRFLYPNPPADQEGAVFTVDQPPGCTTVWTTTIFDLPGGHIQYVNVTMSREPWPAPELLTRIDIRLAKNGGGTEVAVVYQRTALHPAANDRVRTLAVSDVRSGPEWQAAIEACGRR